MKPDLKLREQVFRKMGWEWRWVVTQGDDGYETYGFAWAKGFAVLTRPQRVWNSEKETYNTREAPPEKDEIPPASYDLPPIETSWEVCTEYLVPFMRGRNYVYFFTERTFSWIERIEVKSIPNISQAEPQELNMWRSSDVKNDNIAHAACEAFIGVASMDNK